MKTNIIKLPVFMKVLATFFLPFFLSWILFEIIGVNFEKSEITNFQNKGILSFILINNLKVFIVIVLGVFLFSIPSFITLIYNALILGFAFAASSNIYQILSISLHGIFEISAFITGAYIAFNGYNQLKNNLLLNLKFLLLGVIFIVVAAILETYISPIIIRLG